MLCPRLPESYIAFFGVFEPLFGGIGATYAVHLRLIGKLVVDFLLVIIELFFATFKGRGARSEYRLEIVVFEAVESVWPKIADRRGCPQQPFFISEK